MKSFKFPVVINLNCNPHFCTHLLLTLAAVKLMDDVKITSFKTTKTVLHMLTKMNLTSVDYRLCPLV